MLDAQLSHNKAVQINVLDGGGPELASLGAGGSGPPTTDMAVTEDSEDGEDDSKDVVKNNQGTKRKPLNVRKEFPETWLWTEEVVK